MIYTRQDSGPCFVQEAINLILLCTYAVPWARYCSEPGMRNTRDHTGAPKAQAGPAHPFMSSRDKQETCHLLQKPPEPQGGPMWAVSAGHGVSLLPQILELVTHPQCCSMEQIRKQNICPFKTGKKKLSAIISFSLF